MKLKAETTGAGLSGAAQSIIQSTDAPFIGFTSSRFQSYGVDFKDEEALIKQYQKVTDLQRALKRKRHTIRSQASRLKELKVEIEELNRRSIASAIRKRISRQARQHLALKTEYFLKFVSDSPVNATVLAVDIRRSTDLMLHCDSPSIFVQFISSLCLKLAIISTNCNGVFDKFTGDGILAFFPSFYSGPDHTTWALKAALECQSFWDSHFAKYAGHFKRLPADTGLGIGIDTGSLHISVMNEDIIIVGEPVVYACRLSSAARFKETLLNQSAHVAVLKRKQMSGRFEPHPVQIKEGLFVSYKSIRTFPSIRLASPEWEKT